MSIVSFDPREAGAVSGLQSGAFERLDPRETEGGPSFGEMLVQAVGEVNALQQNAGETVQRFATGEPIDIHQVMIAMEQASTAMALTMQVRNRLVEAYQEIMRMQV
jgi:flagellar hook-basal body complex protein FliE